MDPVWTLFSRRTFAQLAYWLSVLGYNLRDRTRTNRFYFIYFCIFWLIWITAVFALLGASGANFVRSLPVGSPSALAVRIGVFSIMVWSWIQLWQATGRSPFVFSEEDAYLLCQTPVSRRKVGLAWFLQSWIGTALPFAAGAIVISFTLVELTLQHGVDYAHLISYFSTSLRALAIVLPLQMAFQAFSWGIGALRLRRSWRDVMWLLAWLRPAVFVLGLILLAGIFLPGLRAVIMTPLSFPLEAAFAGSMTLVGWLVRAALVLAYIGTGLLFLIRCSDKIHLGRAAQETQLHAAVQLARGSGNFSLVDTLEHRRHLGTTHAPSRLPARPGVWMLVWKDAVQSLRSLRAGQALGWVFVFGLGLEIFLLSNFPVQMVMGALWTIALGGLTTERLRADLARWWLLRSLPLRANNLLIAELGLSCGLGALLGWLALAVSGKPPLLGVFAAVLVPILVAISVLAAAHDILSHSKARNLMSPSIAEENVARQNIEGVIRALLSVAVPMGMMCWSLTHPAQIGWALAAVPLAWMIMMFNLRTVGLAYRWME
jgi:hypothetical protein